MTIAIPCPKCGKSLRLPDASVLGKMGRCPKCEHKFVLALPEPEEVPLELVQTPTRQPADRGQKPAAKVGVAAEWVPDETPVSPITPTVQAPVFDLGGDSLSRLKRKRKKRPLPQRVAIAAFFVILAVGAFYGYQTFLAPQIAASQAASVAKKAPQKAKSTDSQNAEEGEQLDSPSAVDAEKENKFGRPTTGEPISLHWIPSGARLVVNMRPADLWKAGGKGEGEFVAALGPVGSWMATTMKEYLKAEPSQIEELLLCVIPGQRGSPPEYAAVVRRTKEHKFKKSDMIEGMTPIETGPVKYYANEKIAMAFQPDLQTYSIAPASAGAEMADAGREPHQTATELEGLLRSTDRSMHFTIVCIPTDLNIHGEVLVPANVRSLLESVQLWISSNDEVEAAAWCFHMTEDKFFSQAMFRSRGTINPRILSKTFQTQLAQTPRQVLEIVERMNPGKVGPRKVIGRVPAMMKVVQLGTKVQTDTKLVSLVYEGPERAAPNLALGALLAWDESTRTNFSASATGAGNLAQSRKPLMELLKTKIDVDFRREPLENAFNFIAGEAKFEIFVDGDGLKTAGYTKNMPQEFKAEGIAASSALAQIQSKYGAMCFVVDESKNLVTVTVLEKAKAQNQKVIVFK